MSKVAKKKKEKVAQEEEMLPSESDSDSSIQEVSKKTKSKSKKSEKSNGKKEKENELDNELDTAPPEQKEEKKKDEKAGKDLENQVIAELAGPDVLPLVEYLRGKKDVSEFIIAKDIEAEIQVIRNQLYRMLDYNLVNFWRKKDKQKGWYIYYWTYNPGHIDFLFWDIKRKRIEKLRERLEREQSDFFFICQDNGCVRLDFEKTTEFNYQCPECGGMMVQQDNSRTKEFLQNQIAELEAELRAAGKLNN